MHNTVTWNTRLHKKDKSEKEKKMQIRQFTTAKPKILDLSFELYFFCKDKPTSSLHFTLLPLPKSCYVLLFQDEAKILFTEQQIF